MKLNNLNIGDINTTNVFGIYLLYLNIAQLFWYMGFSKILLRIASYLSFRASCMSVAERVSMQNVFTKQL